jgi:hypothetical protein
MVEECGGGASGGRVKVWAFRGMSLSVIEELRGGGG